MIRGPSTSDELSLSSSSSSSINSWRVDEGGANTANNIEDAEPVIPTTISAMMPTTITITPRVAASVKEVSTDMLRLQNWMKKIGSSMILLFRGMVIYDTSPRENNDLSSTNNGNDGANMDYNIAW